MRKLKDVFLICGLLPGLALAQPNIATGGSQRDRLLEQILLGEALNRDDLVDSSLARLQQMAPDSPEALAAQARLVIRRGDPRTAGRLLNRLYLQAPDSAEWRQIRVLLKLAMPGGQKELQDARLLAEKSLPEAVQAYERVLDEQLPSLELALEYWRLRSRMGGQRPLAIANLETLARKYPGHAGLHRQLADLLFSEDRPREALALLHALAQDPVASPVAAQREFQYLNELPLGKQSVEGWQTFITLYPLSALLDEARIILAHQQQKLADPAWQTGLRGQALLDKGLNAEAEAELRRALRHLPEEAGLHGALGLALMRQGRQSEALAAFTAARRFEQDIRVISKWQSLLVAAQYWAWVERAEQAREAGNPAQARELYARARRQQPREPAAMLGLAELARAEGKVEEAERLLLRVQRLAPDNDEALRGLLRLYQAQSPERATAFLESLLPARQQAFATQLRDLRLALLQSQIEAAARRGDLPETVRLLAAARQLAPDDPWLAHRLAENLVEQGQVGQAEAVFRDLLGRQGLNPQARYAHALHLAATGRDGAALESLQAIPLVAWNEEVRLLARQLRRRQLQAHAESLRAAGHEPAAVALLESQKDLADDDLLRLAGWAQERGDHERALGYFQRAETASPGNALARLGRLESWIALGRLEQVRGELQASAPAFVAGERDAQRRLANAWGAAGEQAHARVLFNRLVAGSSEPEPLLLRDAARQHVQAAPQQALDLYARALRDAGELPTAKASPRDDRALTLASRPQDGDDWLKRSLRSEVESLYLKQTPIVRLQHDFGWRNDDNVTPGLSDMDMDTVMLQLDLPLAGGRGFLRVDEVNLDVGRFDTDADGRHTESFGSCALPGLEGCRADRQRARGTAVALGWRGERLAFDIGRSPQGFEIENWLGGTSYDWDYAGLGWTLTASRRPLSNSLLSYAGTEDPRTGIRWGGVTANGVGLGLSYDQGGSHGVWADFGLHWLRGKNVEDNLRTRLMSGYYYKAIENVDERLRLGLNVMYWHYERDLSDYTLGQGGYFSPQQYTSLAMPVNYAWRNADWSVALEGAVSWSRTVTDDSEVYPLERLIAGPLSRAGRAIDRETLDRLNTRAGDSSSSVGYRLGSLVERRVSDHLVLGGAFSWQQARDYAPSYAQIYLRYLFDPWQGALPLGGDALVPYSEFK
ncbi:cellulose synthase complex outer membrane protein BcsC [Azotobacter armeniacus]